ncbi:unnamed protein product, partial [Effrenium voratum]
MAGLFDVTATTPSPAMTTSRRTRHLWTVWKSRCGFWAQTCGCRRVSCSLRSCCRMGPNCSCPAKRTCCCCRCFPNTS